MKIMLRVREPSKAQKKYFGDTAFRPFAIIENVSTEKDIRYWLDRAIAARFEGLKVEGGRLMFVPGADSEIQYAVLDGARISGGWHSLEA